MAYEYRIVRRVEFSETDMAGIVHYSNFFRYMEAAEHAFFRSIGFSVVTRNVDPPVGWPRVHAECDYRRPIRFEDEIEIRMYVTRKKSKSLTYGFWFWKMEGEEMVDVARGSLTVVCVRHKDGRMKAAMIPTEIANKIEIVPARVLRELMKKSKGPHRK
jgi:YbgC/YbaW family acyl-CoA thioester hydrolase